MRLWLPEAVTMDKDAPKPIRRLSGEHFELLRGQASAYAGGVEIYLNQEGVTVDNALRDLLRDAYEAGYMMGLAAPDPDTEPDTTA